MDKRGIPQPMQSITYLASRYVAEKPDQRVEFGWEDIEKANQEYTAAGQSGLMMIGDADTGVVRVSLGKLSDQLAQAAEVAKEGEARGLTMQPDQFGHGFVGVRAAPEQPKDEWKPENPHIERLVANARLASESLPPGREADAAFILGMQIGLTLARDYWSVAVETLGIMEEWFNAAKARGEAAFDVIPPMVEEIGTGVEIPDDDPRWGGIK